MNFWQKKHKLSILLVLFLIAQFSAPFFSSEHLCAIFHTNAESTDQRESENKNERDIDDSAKGDFFVRPRSNERSRKTFVLRVTIQEFFSSLTREKQILFLNQSFRLPRFQGEIFSPNDPDVMRSLPLLC